MKSEKRTNGILFRLSTLLALCFLHLSAMAQAKLPNVVILFTDDHGTLDANCYGSPDLITPNIDELAQSNGSVDLIDVRTPVEFREVHSTYARNVPLDSLDPQAVMAARNGNADRPLYVICRSGARGAKACEQSVKAGYNNIVNVEGGTSAWEQAGLPVVRGKKAISLQR